MSCYPHAALLLLFWASAVGLGEAFSIAPQFLNAPKTGMARHSTKQSAYYYEFTGNDDDNDNDDITSGGVIGNMGESEQVVKTSTNVVQTLNQQKDALARVVSAFPPTGHAFELSQIEDVSVLSVDERHMELEVALCEAESCAAVVVPVKFSHPCEDSSSSNLEECVLENFGELDQQAQLLAQHAELEALNNQAGEGQASSYVLGNKLLDISHEKVQYPSWWVSSSSPELVAECDKLRDTFNEEEFADEIRLLAKFGLGFSSVAHVKDAIVRDIGPAGIIVQSQLQMEGTTDATVTTDGLVGIPIAFPTVASNSQELRSYALSVLDQAAL